MKDLIENIYKALFILCPKNLDLEYRSLKG